MDPFYPLRLFKQYGNPVIVSAVETIIHTHLLFQRVAHALKISEAMVSKIKKRSAQSPMVLSPVKNRPRKKSKTTNLDEPIKSEVRQVIYNMYSDSKCLRKCTFIMFSIINFFSRKTYHLKNAEPRIT